MHVILDYLKRVTHRLDDVRQHGTSSFEQHAVSCFRRRKQLLRHPPPPFFFLPHF